MKRFYHRTTLKTPPRGCKVYPLFTHMHTTTHSTLYGEIEGVLTIHGYLLALNYGNPPAPDHPVTKHIMKLNRLADTFHSEDSKSGIFNRAAPDFMLWAKI